MKKQILFFFCVCMGISVLSFGHVGYNFTNVAGVEAGIVPDPSKNIPVTLTNVQTGAVTQAVLSVTKFAVKDGKVVAVGTLDGKAVEIPVTSMDGTCDILNLDLGPLRLDLLGLVVDLSKVDLDITAQSGSGKLLGNLLCSVAKLLDSHAAAQAIVNKLNNILGELG